MSCGKPPRLLLLALFLLLLALFLILLLLFLIIIFKHLNIITISYINYERSGR